MFTSKATRHFFLISSFGLFTLVGCGGGSDKSAPPTDTTPAAFTFTDLNHQPIDTIISSSTIVISAINSPSPISISGGEYAINGGAFTSSNGTVNNNDQVVVRLTTSTEYSAEVNTTLTVGGISDVFNAVTIPAPDTTPDAFAFIDATLQPLNSIVISNSITVQGIAAPSPISISGGEYAINGGAFTSDNGTVNNNDQVAVRLKTSTEYATAAFLSVNIGDVTGTYQAYTHSSNVRLASDLANNSNAKFSIVTQPFRGRVIASSDLKTVTFKQKNAFDYLKEGESEPVSVTAHLLGSDQPHTLTFNAIGRHKEAICNLENTIKIAHSGIPDTYSQIPVSNCVSLDASSFADGYWVAWLGDNGAARDSLFVETGIDTNNPTITFEPPTKGKYTLAWCPKSSNTACLANFYFESTRPSTEHALNYTLDFASTNNGNIKKMTARSQDDSVSHDYSYRWVVHHWNGKYVPLIDVLTTTNTLELPTPLAHNNYYVSMNVDDNKFQAEGGFSSGLTTRHGNISINFHTVGNSDLVSSSFITRDPDSQLRPPKVVVSLEGFSQKFTGGNEEPYQITFAKNAKVMFDMNDSTDENGDKLFYKMNQVSVDQNTGQYQYTALSNLRLYVCANDDFPWTFSESPCAEFWITVTQ